MWSFTNNPEETDSVKTCSTSGKTCTKLVHHNIGLLDDTSTSLTTWLDASDFRWALTGTPWITEAQTYYVIGDDGSFLLAQMAYSNLGWPYTSCQITARYYKPNAAQSVHKFETQTVSSMRMKVTDNNTSIQALNSSITAQTASGNGKGVNFRINYEITPATASQPTPLTVSLNFSSLTNPLSIGDGTVHFGKAKADGYINMKFIPAGRCTGTVRVDGKPVPFEGQGICIQQYQGIKPHNSAKRWNCAFFVEDAASAASAGLPARRSLFMIQMLCSAAYDEENFQQGFYFDGHKMGAVTGPGCTISYGSTVTDKETGYSVPEHFDYTWRGADYNGNPFQASCSGTPTARMARIDLLENIPSVLRKVIESLTSARPYIYQHFDHNVQCSFTSADGSTSTVTGSLFQEFSFLLDEATKSTPSLSSKSG